MVFKKFFGGKDRKDEEEFDPLADLALENMKHGYLVDYDMKSWEVTARHTYDWGEGHVSQEWELRCGDDMIYLERDADDDAEWAIMRKIRIADIKPDARRCILDTDDPPETVTYDGATFEMESDRAGYYHKNVAKLSDAKGEGQQLIAWDYEDDTGRRLLTIEQWGEDDFEAGLGIAVEEYMFTNVLPR